MTARRASFAAALLAACVALAAPPVVSVRIERMNEAFLRHLAELPADAAVAVATVREGYAAQYQAKAPQSFIPDALAVIHADFRAALDAFDAGASADAAARFARLRKANDPWLAANATYFEARGLIDLSRFEDAAALLGAALADRSVESRTPYGPHLWLMRGYCEARTMNLDEAPKSLTVLRDRFPDAPESVLIGARQLSLDMEHLERGSLGEVAGLMDDVGDRLTATDVGDRTRSRQEQILKLLDKLIEDQQKQEQQSGGGQSQSGGKPKDGQGKGQSQAKPTKPRDESEAEPGQGGNVDLHAAPKTQPGEMWGQLPPAEREKILQSIRERYPSRYRQIVEQYYRSLAEDK